MNNIDFTKEEEEKEEKRRRRRRKYIGITRYWNWLW